MKNIKAQQKTINCPVRKYLSVSEITLNPIFDVQCLVFQNMLILCDIGVLL